MVTQRIAFHLVITKYQDESTRKPSSTLKRKKERDEVGTFHCYSLFENIWEQ